MAGERTFVVKFISDILGATKGIKKVGDDLGTLGKQVDTGFGQKFKSVMPSFKQFAVAGTAAFAAASAGAYKAIQSASDLAESQSKVGVVFGDSAKLVNDFAKTSATSFGITKQAALEATGTYGNLFQAFGVGQGEAATMSTTLVALAADLASFNNTTIDDAILALRSGLSGETEPLKKYGIAINDVRLKEEARNMGLYKGTGALSVTAKTQAAYALILKDSTLAQGDFERTSGGLANQQRILKAQLSDVTAQIGSVMIPAFLGAVSFINDSMLPAFRDFGSALEEGGLAGGFDFIATRFKESAPKVMEALGEMITQAVEWIATSGLPMLYAGINQLADSLTGWIEPRIPMFISNLTKFLMAGYDWIYTKGLPQLLSAVQALGDTLASFVGKAARQLPAQLVTMLGTIGGWVLSEGIPALLAMGTRLAGSLVKWTVTIGAQLIAGLGGAVVALVAAIPDIFAGFVKGIANVAVNTVKGFVGKFGEMKTALANVAVSVVNTLIDVFNKIPLIPNIPKITLDTKKLGTQVGLTGAQLQTVNERFDDVNGTLKVGSDVMNDFKEETKKTETATGGASKTMKTAKEKLEMYTDALKKSTSAQKGFSKAQKDTKSAQDDLAKANSDVITAQAALDKAVSGFGAGSPEAIKAQKELDQAQRGVERAGYRIEESLFAVADAEKALAEVRKDPESTPQAIREAEIALAEAKLSSKDAIDEQKEATDGLIESQSYLNELVNGAIIGSEFYTKFSEELTEAQKRQADAQDKLADAKDREAEAQERLNEALQKTAELITKYPKVLGGMPNPVAIATGAQTLADNNAGSLFNGGGMGNVNIEVNAGLGASGIEVGQEIEQYLKEYLNFTGGQFSFGSIGSIF
jgi:hypothetical protein